MRDNKREIAANYTEEEIQAIHSKDISSKTEMD